MKPWLEDQILNFADGNIANVAPALSIRAFQNGKPIVELDLGESYRYYDLASLTKILFTTVACMRAYEQNEDFVSTPLSFYRQDFSAENVTPERLLSHVSGFSAWAPFFRQLKRVSARGEKTALTSGVLDHERQWREMTKKLKKIAPLPSVSGLKRKSIYSDIDFLFLGVFLEDFFKKSLLDIWQEQHFQMRLSDLHFCVDNQPKGKRSSYAPTEKSRWRKKLLQGEVHDDNTWALGGVAPHAGLFGSIEALSDILLRFRKVYRGGRDPMVRPSTLKKFVRRQIPKSRGDWGLGFMLPTKGQASSGQYFSADSFGHTGFTGTSFWYDPKRDLLVVILSNRVCPSRRRRKFVKLRPLIHDWIVTTC